MGVRYQVQYDDGTTAWVETPEHAFGWIDWALRDVCDITEDEAREAVVRFEALTTDPDVRRSGVIRLTEVV